jgi:hypothetical protein
MSPSRRTIETTFTAHYAPDARAVYGTQGEGFSFLEIRAGDVGFGGILAGSG